MERIKILLLLFLGWFLLSACTTPSVEPITISSFEECVEAGYSVMESYPRQCQVDGITFTEKLEENENLSKEEILDSYGNTIPESCSSWYDGCNNCMVMEEGFLACTLMYCEVPGEARCLDEERTSDLASCPDEFDPVCGIDGTTYGNGCLADLNNVSIAYSGACLEEGRISETVSCPDLYSPVCGVDGATYGNGCLADLNNVSIAYSGACLDEERTSDLASCPDEFDPVCGVDGTTYGNGCLADLNNVSIAYSGACSDEERFLLNENEVKDSYGNTIPESCSSWYDGCNNCRVMENGLLACTLMYCEVPGEARCLD